MLGTSEEDSIFIDDKTTPSKTHFVTLKIIALAFIPVFFPHNRRIHIKLRLLQLTSVVYTHGGNAICNVYDKQETWKHFMHHTCAGHLITNKVGR